MKIKIRKEEISITIKNSTWTYPWYYFNPIYRIKRYLERRFHNKIFKLYPHIQCQGCGEGIIKYTIKDPNHSYKRNSKRWKVCDKCVNFYDRHFSKKEVVLK